MRIADIEVGRGVTPRAAFDGDDLQALRGELLGHDRSGPTETEAWIGGVSTRRVDELVQAMGFAGISKSQVSKLCKDIGERVHAFLDRPLAGDWPYLWLDATYLKQREGGRIVSSRR